MIRLVILAALVAVPVPVLAQALSGAARAVDGDSLTVGAHRVRLFGIDAPEYRQTCLLNYSNWACGGDAAAAARTIVDGQAITCVARDTDVYGRTVANCLVNGEDVAAAMVRQGYAVVLDNGRADYAALEASAKQAKRGIWASKFEMPAQYRKANPRASDRLDLASAGRASASQWQAPARATSYMFRNCVQARAAGAAPMRRGQPTYNPNLDGDNDGIACEPYRGRR